jgi:hypothetical protein
MLYATQRAWCLGKDPNADELEKLKAALSRMKAKGGVCAQLAALGEGYLASGNLHMIDDQARYWDDYEQRSISMGAAAPRNGGNFSYIAIGYSWTKSWYDAQHATPEGTESRTLQQILAHELDHLNGEDHLQNNMYRTTNSQQCSDLAGY